MENLMRSKQTAEAAARGTSARRPMSKSLYAAFLLFAVFSVSGFDCLDMMGADNSSQMTTIRNLSTDYTNLLATVKSELSSPNPDLFQIGTDINSLESDRETLISDAQADVANGLKGGDPDWNPIMGAVGYAKLTWVTDIAGVTAVFNSLGGWSAANLQHQVLTSGGTWTWTTPGTNPDLNPGGPTFNATLPPASGGTGGGGIGGNCPPPGVQQRPPGC
jgi:hypothetical protein